MLTIGPVLTELSIERPTTDAEGLGRQGFVATRSLHHLEDVALLDLLQRHQLFEVVAGDEYVARFETMNAFRQVFGPQVIELRQRDRALDSVAQLSDVAGPRISEKPLRGGFGETDDIEG